MCDIYPPEDDYEEDEDELDDVPEVY